MNRVKERYLFEAVGLEDLKTSDIQHTNEGHTLRLAQNHVDLLHDPEEKSMVDLFTHQSLTGGGGGR